MRRVLLGLLVPARKGSQYDRFKTEPGEPSSYCNGRDEVKNSIALWKFPYSGEARVLLEGSTNEPEENKNRA